MLGDLVVRIGANIKEFTSKMDSVAQKTERVGQKFQSVGRSISMGFTLPAVGLGAYLVKEASDAEETAQKFETVFGDISTAAENSADTLTESFGLSSQSAKELLGDTGDILTGFGFTQESALGLSEEVNKLAVDLASFTNFQGGAAGASKALTKALLGEAESVKSLGIVIRQDTEEYKNMVEQTMRANNVSKVQAKAMVALKIATEQSKNAVGDYARTQQSFANQLRTLKERVRDLAVEFGEVLIPAATKILNKVKGLTEVFSGFTDETKQTIVASIAVVAALGPVLLIMGKITTSVITLTTAIKGLNLALLANPYFLAASAIAALSLGFFKAYKNAQSLNEEIDKALEIKPQGTEEEFDKVTQAISTVEKKIADTKNSMTSYSAAGVKATREQIEKLEDKRAKLITIRDEIALLRHDQKVQSDEAVTQTQTQTTENDNLVQSIDRVRIAVSEPINNIIDPSEEARIRALREEYIKFGNVLYQIANYVPPDFSHRFDEGAESADNFSGSLTTTAETINTTFANSINSMVVGLAKGIGQMAVGAKSFGEIGLSLLSALGSMAMKIGTLFITLGKSVASALNPVTLFASLGTSAIGAGVALIAAGAGLKAIVGGLQEFHSGGIVPGVGDVPIMAKGGEMVLTESQQGFLSKMINSPTGQNVNVTVTGRLDGSDIYVSGQRGGVNWNR